MFRTHDNLNIPTYVHISLIDEPNPRESIKLPFSFRLDNPTLERIAVKKLKSVERGYVYPTIDVVFVKGEVTLAKREESDETNCGFYKSVQTISRKLKKSQIIPEVDHELNMNGYLIFAYKTMEDMHTQKFTESWKTWSGARMLCTKMPMPHLVTKLSFYRRVSGHLTFEYLLIAKIKNMMLNAAPALNVLHYMKPKVCAYVGAYRKISFEVNRKLCDSLGLIEADYVNALTSRMRVTYSNNTGYVQLSNDIEFRCIEEEEELRHPKDVPKKVSTQMQTDPTTYSMRKSRRTLPRTISSFPVPGTANSPSIPSPDSVIQSILENRNKIVTIGNNFLLVLDNREGMHNIKYPFEINKITDHKSPDQNKMILTNNQTSYDDLPKINNFSSSNKKDIKKNENDDSGSLLRRLKTEYFNSEEYTAAELCQFSPI
ncbi:unnamed protein product [Caenorhabditis angaria]|uniref:DUF7153 domain-containing protein n=1 Tax=Caenorhabditis angaria TaxID=860376 RepID=A0A9P1J1W7_9PELO|nr:unnamed protein product [Caenorhabditis angaria]